MDRDAKAKANQGGVRARALYTKFHHEACRQLQAEEYLERQRIQSRTDYCTSYEENHGKPGFEPAVEKQLREGAALAELHPLGDCEPVLSLWYCLQRQGAGRKVSPPHSAAQPFRRTSGFTTPTHLSLHESPVERQQQQQQPPRPRLDLLDRMQVRGWLAAATPAAAATTSGGAGGGGRGSGSCSGWPRWPEGGDGPRTQRYPLADVVTDEKHWCDRHEDPVRETGHGVH